VNSSGLSDSFRHFKPCVTYCHPHTVDRQWRAARYLWYYLSQLELNDSVQCFNYCDPLLSTHCSQTVACCTIFLILPFSAGA